jgi:hypothetical protein
MCSNIKEHIVINIKKTIYYNKIIKTPTLKISEEEIEHFRRYRELNIVSNHNQ